MIYLSKNLKLLRKKQEMGQGKLAELLSMKSNTISNYENGVSTPDYNILEKIISIFNVSAHDILYTDIEASPQLEKSKFLTYEKNDMITQLQNSPYNVVSEPTQRYTSDSIISIPIVDVSAAAGHGYFNSDYPETLGEITLPSNLLQRRSGNYYCGRVDGDSMEPTLLYGDFIVFRLLQHQEWGELKDGDIYFIVNRSGASFVKRIKNRLKEEGVVICQSDNPDKRFREFPIQNDYIANIYHIEWRLSNDMTNVNQLYFNRIDMIEEQIKDMQDIIENINQIQHKRINP